jgi:hypothetical protein
MIREKVNPVAAAKQLLNRFIEPWQVCSSHIQMLYMLHMLANSYVPTTGSSLPPLPLQPTYLVNTLSVDLTSAAQTALLPPIAGIAASACAGALGDALIKQGVPTAGVRKIAQSIGFLAPTAFLAYASQVNPVVEVLMTANVVHLHP